MRLSGAVVVELAPTVDWPQQWTGPNSGPALTGAVYGSDVVVRSRRVVITAKETSISAPEIRFNDGDAYERSMGVWSRLAGDIFLE